MIGDDLVRSRASSVPALPNDRLRQSPSRGSSFREHVGFLGLMLISFACTVHLMILLRPLLRPFLWAVFLVMGLTPAVSVVERALLYVALRLWFCGSWFVRCCWRIFKFLSTCLCLLRRCDWRKGVSGSIVWQEVWQWDKQPSVKRRQTRSGSCELQAVIGASSAGVRQHHTPMSPSSAAVKDGSSESDIDTEANDEAELGRDQPWTPCARFIAHALAIVIVVLAVVCVICGFVVMIIQSVVSLQGNWKYYQQGARNVADSARATAATVFGTLSKEVADELAQSALQKVESIISAIIIEIASNIHHFIFEFLMMTLYIFFWLSNPMPVWSSMEELFKRYIILKFIACLGYGVCVGLLLWVLGIDLAAPIGLAALFLSFIPEIGPFVAVVLPTPVILFDGRLETPALTLVSATTAQLALKFLFANIVEVKLVEADQLMKMHPVIILLAIAFFGYIWGATGMLLSVPLVAIFKVAMLSEDVPSLYRDPVLVVLEGDRHAPANYAKKRQGASGSRGDLGESR